MTPYKNQDISELPYPKVLKDKKLTGKKIIEINDLNISFGKQEVLKKVSLDLFEGENLIILGKSGSGKSVLIKCITGLLTPDSGRIRVFGQDTDLIDQHELAELRKKIGFLFQSGALYDSMTVKENLEFPLRRIKKNLTRNELDDKIVKVLKDVGLAEVLDKLPSELSGGMRKRIALARTIIVDPLIMLYDEPTTGLDPITSAEISSLINKIQKDYLTSAVIITHDMECVRKIADRIILLKDGEIYAEGKLEELENSDDIWVRPFFKSLS